MASLILIKERAGLVCQYLPVHKEERHLYGVKYLLAKKLTVEKVDIKKTFNKSPHFHVVWVVVPCSTQIDDVT